MTGKLSLFFIFLFASGFAHAQSVFGYWYGTANVKSKNSANNYLVELIVQPEKGYVTAIVNYYFKDSYRSIKVKGNYNAKTRELNLYDIPVTYHGSNRNMEVDCIMNLRGILKVAKGGSTLSGEFSGMPEYKYTCVDMAFKLNMSADMSKQDSVLNALRNYKETRQVWTPSAFDTLAPVNVLQRKVVNYVIENEFKQREDSLVSDIEINNDSVSVDFYDNGEIDGDSISIFYNKQLMAFSRRLSTRPVHFSFMLDSTREYNELTMFADNLGSIPPNTALMIIHDGKTRHEIRMASSLTKNATIRLRKKKR